MSDQEPQTNDPAPTPPSGAPQAVSVRILGQFVRDMSFENPGLVQGLSNEQPKIEGNVEINAGQRSKDQPVYEVMLRLTARATQDEGKKVVYIQELLYSGVFEIQSASPEQLERILMIDCPNLLFPYAREAISSTVQRGGFPEFLLQPINFDALYLQAQAQAKAQAAEQASGGNGGSPETH